MKGGIVLRAYTVLKLRLFMATNSWLQYGGWDHQPYLQLGWMPYRVDLVLSERRVSAYVPNCDYRGFK